MREIRLGSGWNLPVGVYESDLPGNRAEDVAWDQWLDTEECAALDGESDETLERAFRAWYTERIERGYEDGDDVE